MTNVSDMELVQAYFRQGSEEAFTTLVGRHINLVHSAALRRVGIAAHAEEITQAVFIILARKAATLRPDTILESWLYETTRLTSSSFRRGERRREWREQEAYMQSTLDESNNVSVWNQMSPLLDEAVSRLGKKDRDAVILRFFKGNNLSEVAAALKVTEAAAQRRVHRALEKLHHYFNKHGVRSTTAVIAGAVSANSMQAAPIGLAVNISVVAAKGAAIGGSTLSLVKVTMKMMTWLKFKLGIIGAVALIGAAASLVVISKLHGQQVHPSRAASLREIQQLFDLATATKPDRCIFEADIKLTTPPYTTEQVRTTLAEIENIMREANARLTPQQKANWEIDQSNAIVKAQSGKRIQHVREWFSGNYYRLDMNDEGGGEERFMKAHPNEYFETWVNIPNSPFSPYSSYEVERELHDMMLFKQAGERFHQYNLWQALRMNQEVAGLFVASIINLRDTNSLKSLKRAPFDYSELKMDPSRAQQLHAQTKPSWWRLEADDEKLDGKAVTHFTLKVSFTLPPGIKSYFKLDTLQVQGEMWVGHISGKAVCLQELMTNLTQHISTVVKREKYDGDGFPTTLTTTKIKADSSFEKERVVFKRIETNPSFTDEEAFAPVFPPDYIVSDLSSGKGVILQNPHPEIPIGK
ncbi:MAG TPA: sigma-70 family RNA polymerase sigma factor [Candidatus Acidoferrum sp.]|jgi:RNA polymerase sigma factor (sigma-70 family)|nr:sigma-70 family RNA polymerase sigma factor [Candidatus Acidoferrum sp.]